MSDPISGVKNVPPTYPVKPVQPGSKDRKSGERKKERSRPDAESERGGDKDSGESGDRPTIDEYV